MEDNKCLEYYLDAKVYGKKEINEIIEKTKKEFLNKKVKVNIILNQFGVYVLTFSFEGKKCTRAKKAYEEKKEKAKTRMEKYYGNYKYGQYKNTGTYKPY